MTKKIKIVSTKLSTLMLVFVMALTSFLVVPVANVHATLEKTTSLIVHYKRTDGNYDGWNLWMWASPSGTGRRVELTGKDDYGLYAKIPVSELGSSQQYGVIPRQSKDSNEWYAKDGSDKLITYSETSENGEQHVYLKQDDNVVYDNAEQLKYDYDVQYASFFSDTTLSIKTGYPVEQPKITLKDEQGNVVPGTILKHTGEWVDYKLDTPLQNIKQKYTLEMKDTNFGKERMYHGEVKYFKYFETDAFAQKYTPDEQTKLGVQVEPTGTSFALWTPTATKVTLKVYDTPQSSTYTAYPLVEDQTGGVWRYQTIASLEGKYYTYEVTNYGVTQEVVDPYAVSATTNGKKALITNPNVYLARNNLAGTRAEFVDMAQPTDAVLYEAHIRDLTIDASSTTTLDNLRGKFLGVVEENTISPTGQTTGRDHLVDLGITHVHFLPMFDSSSIDEANLANPQFNWGYDPQLYNVPEGSYSTNPVDGYVRIKEMRTMIKELHESGIGTVMDVVYNHTSKTKDSDFNKLVPDYYYRQNTTGGFANGSGCGNETASDRKMFRKFMIDSVAYLADTYKIDGFRFDLMGIHDIETMNAISAKLHEINPDVIIYGEGWAAETPAYPSSKLALKENTSQLKGIASFNDGIRNAVKGQGDNEIDKGFVNGGSTKDAIMSGVHGEIGSYAQMDASHTINYADAHDNLTLRDKLYKTTHASNESLEIMQKRALSIILTSQGIPFLHSGSEMMRTKNLEHNSYNLPDGINQINYRLKDENTVTEYVSNLIKVRKEHPMFRQTDGNQIYQNVLFKTPDNMVQDTHPNRLAYTIKLKDSDSRESWKEAFIAFNGSNESVWYTLTDGKWIEFADTNTVKLSGIRTLTRHVEVKPHSTLMAYRSKDVGKLRIENMNNESTLIDSEATYKITDSAGYVRTLRTYKGVLELKNLPVGTYTLEEIALPTGYEKEDGVKVITVTITKNHETLYESYHIYTEHNTPPTISGVSDKTISQGSIFNLMQGVSATDAEDGNLTNEIIVSGTVNTALPGTYTITYTVQDSTGSQTEKNRVITVVSKENKVPSLSGISDMEVPYGSTFDPMKGVVATDTEDGDVTQSIRVSGTVNTNVPGVYTLTYTVKDSGGSTVTNERKITVGKSSVVCLNNVITEGKYRHYVNNCTDKVLVYTLEYATAEKNYQEEPVKAYEYPTGTVYKEATTPQEMKARYGFYMKAGVTNTSRKYHGVVAYAEKYNAENQVLTYYEYYDGANYRSNNHLKFKRVFQMNITSGTLRSEERRLEGKTTGYVLFEFFGKEGYVRDGKFNKDNNLKTTFKLGTGNVIEYAYGKYIDIGPLYYYTYQLGTVYGQNHGAKIISSVSQDAPVDLPQY